MRRVLLCALLVGGCRNLSDPGAEDIDGRPGAAAARLGPVVNVGVASATTNISNLLYTDCEGESLLVPVTLPVDLEEGTKVPLEAGDWCDLQVQLGQFTQIRGSSLTVDWEIELRTEFLALGGGQHFRILRERSYVLEFGDDGWLSFADLAVEDTATTFVTIDRDHPAHQALNEAVTLRSALYEDGNRSTTIDGSERATSLVAKGPNRN